jgi:hypothetical protein
MPEIKTKDGFIRAVPFYTRFYKRKELNLRLTFSKDITAWNISNQILRNI